MTINSEGICRTCQTQSIHYGIERGRFTYFCVQCNATITKKDILIEKKHAYSQGNALSILFFPVYSICVVYWIIGKIIVKFLTALERKIA